MATTTLRADSAPVTPQPATPAQILASLEAHDAGGWRPFTAPEETARNITEQAACLLTLLADGTRQEEFGELNHNIVGNALEGVAMLLHLSTFMSETSMAATLRQPRP